MGEKGGIKHFIMGLVIGAAAWPPGLSGGVVAVLFGIYERLIDDLNNLRRKIKEDFAFIFSVGLGLIVGIIIMAFAVKWALEDSRRAVTMFLFAGLIIGQIPSLVKISKKGEKVRPPHIMWFAIGLAILMALLALDLMTDNADRGAMIDSSATMVAVAFAILVGVLFGLTTIIPGISGATVLLALGLFTWMNDFITGMELIKFIPFALGFVITIFAVGRIMGYILKNYHHAVYYFILGLTVGSTILILVTSYVYDITGTTDLFYGIAACAAGTAISLALSSIKVKQKDNGSPA